MITKSIQAWVIHKRWSGDTSARVKFFTRDLGLIDCLCRGGRTPKKQALLQPFTPLWLSLDERHERHYVRSFEANKPTLNLASHALFSAIYINELLYHVLKPLNPDVHLYDAYEQILQALAATQDRLAIEVMLRRFEWSLLKHGGHSFSFQHEARTNDAISPACNYQFIPGEGFTRNNHGIPGQYILAIGSDELAELAHLKYAKQIMRLAIDHLLNGKVLKARELYVLPQY